MPPAGTVEWFDWVVESYRSLVERERRGDAVDRVGDGCCVVPFDVVEAVGRELVAGRKRWSLAVRMATEELGNQIDMLRLVARADFMGRSGRGR